MRLLNVTISLQNVLSTNLISYKTAKMFEKSNGY